MDHEIALILQEGSQSDLEWEFRKFMVGQVDDGLMVITKDNFWGESYVLQGNTLHGIQWKFIVEEEYDENDNLVGVYFEDGYIDFEVDCSWYEIENY